MGLGASKRKNEPAEFTRRHPHFRHFIEVAPGFWNYRTDFFVGSVLNVKTHMSVLLLESGEAIPAFHAAYPVARHRKFYGCPRHINLISEDTNGSTIAWEGDLNKCSVRSLFAPDIEMRIPAGSEFVDPKPAHRNHFCGVFLYHRLSKTVVQDDTVLYVRQPGLLLQMFGFSEFTMHFNPSIRGPGLHPTEEAPIEFLDWFHKLLEEWDFENLISAHNGGCFGIAKETALALITAQEPFLRKLSRKNAARAGRDSGSPDLQDEADDTPHGWSENLMHTECG